MNFSFLDGVAFGLIILMFIVLIAAVIVYVLGLAKLFQKAGIEGWKAIIPFYSDYLFVCKVCGLHWAWFAALMLITFTAFESLQIAGVLRTFVKAMSFYNLAIKCHKEDKIPSLIFGALFPEITTIVYGFGSSEYDYYQEVKSSGLF